MKWIRKDLRNFKPYRANTEQFDIRLDANESPFNLTGKVKEDLLYWINNCENLNIYPDSDSNGLKDELSLFWNVSNDNIICGVGSDQLIDYITKVFIEPDDTVITLKPTFSMYSLSAVLNHGKVKEIPLKDGFSYDIYDIIKAANVNNAKLLFLCTPNNPTGNSFTERELLQILESVDCPVVIDEAYAEFAGQTMIPHIHTHENLIVLRTFSKAYGLAGARVGYALACEAMINAIGIVKSPYNLCTLSQLLAISALRDSNEYKKRISDLIENRNELYEKLKDLKGLNVYPSDGNFLFIESNINISEALKNDGIIVRNFEDGEKRSVRISIGTKEQNIKVYEIIKKMLSAD